MSHSWFGLVVCVISSAWTDYQKSAGGLGGLKIRVCSCERARHGRKRSIFSVSSTPHPRAGVTSQRPMQAPHLSCPWERQANFSHSPSSQEEQSLSRFEECHGAPSFLRLRHPTRIHYIFCLSSPTSLQARGRVSGTRGWCFFELRL